MATASQRDWVRRHRAAAVVDPNKYAPIRIRTTAERETGVAAAPVKAPWVKKVKPEPEQVAALQMIPEEPKSVPSIIPDTRGQLTIPTLPLIHEVEPTFLKYTLLEGLEKYAVAPPVEVRRRPPSDYYVNTNVVSDSDVSQSLEQKISDIQKQATTPTETELSAFSQGIYESSVHAADFIRKFKPNNIPTINPVETKLASTVIESGARTLASTVIESGARTVEMVGMLAGGTEILIKEPQLLKPALTVGLYGSTFGLAKQLKEEPLQTISDLTVMAGLFHGVGRVGSRVINAEIPYTISRKATIPEGVLLKGEIKAPKVDVKPPETKAIIEYTPPKVETFVGKVKGDVADLYVKVPESEMGMLKTMTSEKAPYQVMTGEGKFTVIDQPTYFDVIPSTKLKLVGETKLTLREQLVDKVPFEVIPKFDLTPVRLQTSIVPERVMIPEFLRTIDVTPSQARASAFEFADTMKTKGLLESGKTSELKDFTEPFRRKDIQEIPYSREISLGIGEESVLLGRVLSKQERGLVRDTIIKERIEFEPVKPQYKPLRTGFSTVGSVTGQQLLMKPKVAPTKFKEPSPIQTINLETDIRMPDTVAQIVPRTKTAPTALKEPVDIPVFDVDAMFKRPTYEQMLSETKAASVSKASTKTRSRLKTAFVPKSRTFNAVGSAYGPIPDTKYDLVASIDTPSVPIPKTRTSTMFDSFVDTEPMTETEPILYKAPPKTSVTFDYPVIKPIVILPKNDKKGKKKTRKTSLKGFEWYIVNPIASPFGTVGTISSKTSQKKRINTIH